MDRESGSVRQPRGRSGHAASDAALPAVERPPTPDPLADTGSLGLLKFNLGRVPASVIPPRSWRRAAWFAVGASLSVAIALAIAAILLVGPPHRIAEIDSLPAYPSFPTASTTGTPAHPETPTTGDAAPDRWTAAAQVTTVPSTSPSIMSAGPVSGKPIRTAPYSPVITTVTGGTALVDPHRLVSLANQFYGSVVGNTAAALDLTADTLRAGGSALLQQRYADVSAIQIQRITVDPARGIAVSLLRLSRTDGSTTVEQRTLQFSLTPNPKITSER
jgi:hypothetical protein